ncbi:Upstream-binding protein 1 [Sarcoptes scabiei]|nr:Upstream-binding protein 1 [Sarcoptes scabiei]
MHSYNSPSSVSPSSPQSSLNSGHFLPGGSSTLIRSLSSSSLNTIHSNSKAITFLSSLPSPSKRTSTVIFNGDDDVDADDDNEDDNDIDVNDDDPNDADGDEIMTNESVDNDNDEDDDGEDDEEVMIDEEDDQNIELPPPSRLPHRLTTMSSSTSANNGVGQWNVDDIDEALAADFDGSLSGLGIELGTASFNMSEALMALPSLASLKHSQHQHQHQQQQQQQSSQSSSSHDHRQVLQTSNQNLNHHNHHNHNHNEHHQHRQQHSTISTTISSLTSNNASTIVTTKTTSTIRSASVAVAAAAAAVHNADRIDQEQHINNTSSSNSSSRSLSTTLMLGVNPNQTNSIQNSNSSNNNDEKPIAVVHGKKNRLAAYGTEDESNGNKRFCLDRDHVSVNNHGDNAISIHRHSGSFGDEHFHHVHNHHSFLHQCSDDCSTLHPDHLKHSSSVPDLRFSNTFNDVTNSNNENGHISVNDGADGGVSIGPSSLALSINSTTSSSTPLPISTTTNSSTFFSHLISSQYHLLNSPIINSNIEANTSMKSSTNLHSTSSSSTNFSDRQNVSVHTSFANETFPKIASPPTSIANEKPNIEIPKFQYVLGASTSMAIKMNEETMTYLNQGQSYEIKLKKVGDLSEMKGKMLKTILRVCFHDRRLQYIEKELIEQWKDQRPSERILEIDYPLSYGICEVQNDPKQINRSDFCWDPTKETGVFMKINSISTEFTQKKHGGEKGIPFQIIIETFCKDDQLRCLHAASCQVKVFKPKGADRKHKTDREKMCRKPISEQEKFQPSYDCTVFTDCSFDAFALYNLSSNSSLTLANHDLSKLSKSLLESNLSPDADTSSHKSNKSSSKSSYLTSPIKTSTPSIHSLVEKSNQSIGNLFSDLSNNSYEFSFENFNQSLTSTNKSKTLTSSTTQEETRKWLEENRFEAYLSMFENFSGQDVLLLSKEDLIQICGLTDGIRLYNLLHSKLIQSKLSIFVCAFNDELFQGIYLDHLTANELQSKLLSSFFPHKIVLKKFCLIGPGGVKILITDDVVRNMQQESLFLIEFIADFKGEYQAIMKPYVQTT